MDKMPYLCVFRRLLAAAGLATAGLAAGFAATAERLAAEAGLAF